MKRTRLASSTALFAVLASAYGCSNDSSSSDSGTGGTTSGSGGASSGGTGAAASGGTDSGGSSSGGVSASGGALPTGGADMGGMGGMGTGGSSSGGTPSGGSAGLELPELLSETGLYANIATRELAPGVQLFEPQFILWTDGAGKNRWIYIPEGEQIDTSDMDNWQYPVGTRIWKDFSRDGVRVETRYITRVKTGGRGWKGVAYIWNAEKNEDQTDATAAPLGMENALGTEHDVPPEDTCRDCHGDRPDWPLGFGAVQLSHQKEGITIDDLIADDILTAPPTEPIVLPGNEEEKAALGYFHVNCGPCHRLGATGTARSKLMMWLDVAKLNTVEETETYQKLVNQAPVLEDSIEPYRIMGNDPAQSEVMRRITLKGDPDIQMPPMGTELVDTEGVATVEAWINSLPAPAP